MGIRVLFQFCFLILIAATAAAQTSYQGLTPGVSTRSDVERVFGQPVRSISDSLSEYTGKIYVQYGKNTSVADRIDIPVQSVAPREKIQAELKLPAEPAASQINSKNRLEEHYGSPHWIILTYSSTTAQSGVQRIGYLSQRLFESAVPNTQPSDQPKPPATQNLPAVTPPASYDQATQAAWDAMLSKDFPKALQLLQDAIRANPDRGNAYSLLGIAYLYGFNDYQSAEKAMRDAISKNDKATVRIIHDHSGNFQLYCYGWLSISGTAIAFKSDEGHGFEVQKSQATEIKLNSFMGAAYSAFHIKEPRQNYNFAPGSLQKAETNLILNLLGSGGIN